MSTEKGGGGGLVLAVVGSLGCPPGCAVESSLGDQGVEHQGEHLGVEEALGRAIHGGG